MKLPKLLLLFLAITLLLPASAGAVTVNLYNDFPDTQGDSGLYAYYYDNSTSQYHELNDAGGYSFNWSDHSPFSTPYIQQISTPNVLMHPHYWGEPIGGDNWDAVLAWKVPAGEGNAYYITGSFADADTGGGDGVFVYLRINYQAPFWSRTLTGSSGDPVYFNESVSLNAGDLLCFGVNAQEAFNWDSTWLQGQITPVPLPPSAVLLGSGLVGLLGLRRFKGR